MNPPPTATELAAAWRAAVAVRGRGCSIVQRAEQLAERAKDLPEPERGEVRRLAWLMLEEVAGSRRAGGA